jgi:type II secretory pathway predicted ATPase ExeA
LDVDPFDFYARKKVCKVLLSQKLFDLAYRRTDDGLRMLSQEAPGSHQRLVVDFLILKIRCFEGLRRLEDMVETFEELIEILKST